MGQNFAAELESSLLIEDLCSAPVSSMAKHPTKRQKISKVKEIQALGTNPLTDDASKDDEERRLESMLFGTKFVPREENDLILLADEDGDGVGGGGQEMNNLMDTVGSLSQCHPHF
jgi:hypothetical protein